MYEYLPSLPRRIHKNCHEKESATVTITTMESKYRIKTQNMTSLQQAIS
jgi:hypothetical protein